MFGKVIITKEMFKKMISTLEKNYYYRKALEVPVV